MKTVLVTTSTFSADDPGPRQALLDAGLSLRTNPFGRKLTESEVQALLAEHRPMGMIAGLEPLTRRVLESAAGYLRVVSRCGTGMESVDSEAAASLSMRLYNTPDAPTQAVAELSLGLILCVLRRIAEADRALRSGAWKSLRGRLLGDKTVGVVGLGRIGSRVAALVQGFGCRVLGFDPMDVSAPGVRRVGLEELIQAADIVTLHLPLSDATRNLFDDRRLRMMKPGAVLINASRGGLVDEGALVEALGSGRLGGAGIDVFKEEPYDGPLKDLPNCVLTSHMGSAAQECRSRMEAEAADNLLKGLRAEGLIT